MEEKKCCCCEKQKNTPRSQELQSDLTTRLNRAIGQLNGIKDMLDNNRYCGDIIIQLSAVESALQNVGYIILKNHLETCVVESIKEDKLDILDEAVELIKRLK